jgi:hypothetical protein
MIDFPSSPTLGQVFNSGTGTIYTWDGVAWNLTTQTNTADRRNRIVNGAMQISQENGTTAVTANGFPVDQWKLGVSSSSSVTAAKQIGGNAVVVTAVPPETSAAAAESVQLFQPIEGINLADLRLGTALSLQLVIAFDVNIPVAGTYWVALGTYTGTHTWLGSYTISAAEVGTWVRKAVVVPAGAINAGTWPVDNTACATLHFPFHCGSSLIGVAGFQSGNLLAGPGQALGLSTAGTCAVANVGLYADPNRTGIAPPFEMPDFAIELAKCKRYWQPMIMDLVANATAAGQFFGVQYPFPTEMRVVPTLAMLSNGTPTNVSSVAFDSPTTLTCRTIITSAAAGTFACAIRSGQANARM